MAKKKGEQSYTTAKKIAKKDLSYGATKEAAKVIRPFRLTKKKQVKFIDNNGFSIRFITAFGDLMPVSIDIVGIDTFLLDRQEAKSLRDFLNDNIKD